MTPLSFLKARFTRPPELSAGSMFALGAEAGAAADNCLWRVCQIRPLAGIPHALIEKLATGVTKTVAVSVLLGDRTFHVVRPSS
jgi:hypothetical protein